MKKRKKLSIMSQMSPFRYTKYHFLMLFASKSWQTPLHTEKPASDESPRRTRIPQTLLCLGLPANTPIKIGGRTARSDPTVNPHFPQDVARPKTAHHNMEGCPSPVDFCKKKLSDPLRHRIEVDQTLEPINRRLILENVTKCNAVL